jgi:hypothetical protein
VEDKNFFNLTEEDIHRILFKVGDGKHVGKIFGELSIFSMKVNHFLEEIKKSSNKKIISITHDQIFSIFVDFINLSVLLQSDIENFYEEFVKCIKEKHNEKQNVNND